MTAPRPAEGPASRSGVRRSGDAYQDLVVWGAAMRVIGPGSRFTQVEVEVNGVGNVDDVILRSTAGDRFGQVKWATTTASQVDEDFLTSSSENEKSLLQKLHRSYGALRTAGGTPTLELITNRTLDGTHPLLGHVDGRTDLLVPYATLAGPKTEAGKGRTLLLSSARVLGGTEREVTWGRLYLTHDEILAAAVPLVASLAWNLSVLNRMQVPEHDPAAGDDFAIYMVEISKRRRPVRLRYTTNNLLDSGPGSPGRLMGQVIEATELARQTLELLGRPTNRLLVWRRAHLGGAVGGEPFGLTLPRTNRDGDYEPGDPAGVSLQRLRRTVQVLIRKEPAQNTQATHDDVYVLRDPQVRGEAQDTVAQGLTDAAGHARATVKMRMLLGGDAGRLVELSDDPGLAQAISAGEYDTATGACTGLTSSPFTEPGLPCTASFLLCLSCPNAVATRRHLPRLTYLHDALTGLRAVLENPVWDQDWREPFACLDSLLTAHNRRGTGR